MSVWGHLIAPDQAPHHVLRGGGVMLAACQSVSEARQKSRMRWGTVSAAAIDSAVCFANVLRLPLRQRLPPPRP
jgi:hypothetical protein